MYWSEVGSNPQIERSGMDGSERKVVLTRGLSRPVSLSVDTLTDRIYWADEKLQCIGSVSLEGHNVRVTLQLAWIMVILFTVNMECLDMNFTVSMECDWLRLFFLLLSVFTKASAADWNAQSILCNGFQWHGILVWHQEENYSSIPQEHGQEPQSFTQKTWTAFWHQGKALDEDWG